MNGPLLNVASGPLCLLTITEIRHYSLSLIILLRFYDCWHVFNKKVFVSLLVSTLLLNQKNTKIAAG